VAYEKFLCGYIERRGIDCRIAPFLDLQKWDWRGLFRHAVGRSVIPHGRHTAPARSALWGMLKAGVAAAQTGAYIRPPDLYCFAHCHYYQEAATSIGRVLTVPGWKAESAVGAADMFGGKNFDDIINIGASKIIIERGGGWDVKTMHWSAELAAKTEAL
jgi:hypothetical protein